MKQKKSHFITQSAAGLLVKLAIISLPLFAANTTFAEAMPEHPAEYCAPHTGEPKMMMPRFPGMGPMAGGREHLPPYLHGIELTEAQRDKIFELQHAQAPRQREQMKALQQSMAALHALSGSEHFDPKQARLLADTHAKALSEVIVMHAESAAKIRTLLTQEQKAQADKAMAHFEQERKHGPRGRLRPSCNS